MTGLSLSFYISLSLYALTNILFIPYTLLQVYKQAFHFQFREPTTGDTHNDKDATEGERGGGDADSRKTGGEATEANESGPGLLELSKPSEFRLKALKQQKYLTFSTKAMPQGCGQEGPGGD